MIVKKLRDKNDWSQEQLAEYSGLNVRTIQRVESGKKASIETLKCLASVFEVDITKLTEEITVIDKETEKWKKLPWWFRANMLGVNSRRHVQIMEFTLLIIAFGSWFLRPEIITTPSFFIAAYLAGWIIRFGDNNDAW
ncbi:MAG: helix-turn-helix transcriptional regulator [Gammaproteobacteria bacterium]|nr:helix-turn-helix transcriptional regulator [Gammaproteobacteria bacterium]